METLYLLIPLSVVLVFVIGVLFWWSLRDGQYDDLEGPAYRLLMDDRDELPVRRGMGHANSDRDDSRGKSADRSDV